MGIDFCEHGTSHSTREEAALPSPFQGNERASGRRSRTRASVSTSRASTSTMEDDSHFETICNECETGGVLDTCDGCCRSWHVECLAGTAMARASRAVPPG